MNEHPVELLFLSKQDVDAIITWEDVVQPVEDVFRYDGEGRLVVPKKDPILMEDGRSMLLAMPGYIKPERVAGMKWMRSYPLMKDGIPQLWGQLLLLSDADTGLPVAVMDATTITAMRTAGGHAVAAAKHLARPRSRVLSVLGSGAQATAGIASFDRHFDLDCIKVYSPNLAAKWAEFSRSLGTLKAELVRCDSPQELCGDCDILLTASASKTPTIEFDWLPKGCLVASMTSFFDLGPDAAKKADKWVVGHLSSDRSQIVEHPAFAGRLFESDIYGTLGQVICGALPGREHSDEIILYTHMGMGALDVAVGKHVCDKARRLGMGSLQRLI